ncbi:MAG: hypothetical protein JSS79_16780 [Bacteroidetes bacterium]|nr:hypothetical protein [Bacteroidota bacterium]
MSSVKNLLCLLAICLPALAFAQKKITVSADSLRLTLPNNIDLGITKTSAAGKTYFQLDRKAFKAFLITMNYYVEQSSISVSNVDVLLKNQNLYDSTFALMNKKLEIESQRSALYKSAYDDLHAVSSQYNDQLKQATADLTELKKEKDRAKMWSFVKGVLWGTAVTGGIFGFRSLR